MFYYYSISPDSSESQTLRSPSTRPLCSVIQLSDFRQLWIYLWFWMWRKRHKLPVTVTNSYPSRSRTLRYTISFSLSAAHGILLHAKRKKWSNILHLPLFASIRCWMSLTAGKLIYESVFCASRKAVWGSTSGCLDAAGSDNSVGQIWLGQFSSLAFPTR